MTLCNDIGHVEATVEDARRPLRHLHIARTTLHGEAVDQTAQRTRAATSTMAIATASTTTIDFGKPLHSVLPRTRKRLAPVQHRVCVDKHHVALDHCNRRRVCTNHRIELVQHGPLDWRTVAPEDVGGSDAREGGARAALLQCARLRVHAREEACRLRCGVAVECGLRLLEHLQRVAASVPSYVEIERQRSADGKAHDRCDEGTERILHRGRQRADSAADWECRDAHSHLTLYEAVSHLRGERAENRLPVGNEEGATARSALEANKRRVRRGELVRRVVVQSDEGICCALCIDCLVDAICRRH